jgi:mortality factor 4-like protein 1
MSVSSSSSSSSSSQDVNSQKETTTTTTLSLRVPPFVPNQRVFCKDKENDGPTCTTLFEAIILKSSWTGQHWTFLVHYLGWNSRWDKWLDEASIFPDTPQLRRSQQAASNKRQMTDAAEISSTNAKKRSVERKKRPPTAEYCELPFLLKTVLVQDREKVMRSPELTTCECCWNPARLVHDVPARVTIQTVLEHFVKCQTKQHDDQVKAKQAELVAKTFCHDLAQLFDHALPKCLLYPPERAQYDAIQADKTLAQKRNVQLYGCEFLLRLVVRLPVLLQDNPKEVGNATLLADLLILLQKNSQAIFKSRYREPTRDELQDWERALKDGKTDIVMDE